MIENLTKIQQKCGHDGLQKGFETLAAFATDFGSKIGPQNDPKSALGSLLATSWGLLGPSWAPLGALLGRLLEPLIGLQSYFELFCLSRAHFRALQASFWSLWGLILEAKWTENPSSVRARRNARSD